MIKRLPLCTILFALAIGLMPVNALAAGESPQIQTLEEPQSSYTFEGKYDGLWRGAGDKEYIRPMLDNGRVVTEPLRSLDTSVVTLSLYDTSEHIWEVSFRGQGLTYLEAIVSGTSYRIKIGQPEDPKPEPGHQMYFSLVGLPHDLPTVWIGTPRLVSDEGKKEYRVQVSSSSDNTAKAVVAYYDQGGQFLRLETVPLLKGENTVTVTSSGQESWKVLAVLSDSFQPLAAAQSSDYQKGVTLEWDGFFIQPGEGFGTNGTRKHTLWLCKDGERQPGSSYVFENKSPSYCSCLQNADGSIALQSILPGDSILSFTVDGKEYLFRWHCEEL